MGLRKAEQAYRSVIAKYGPLPAACRGLAQILVRRGRYQQAVGVYRELLRQLPGHKAAEQGLREASLLGRVTHMANPLLTAAEQVLQVGELRTPGRQMFALVTARLVPGGFYGVSHADIQVRLVRMVGSGLEQVAAYPLADPRFPDSPEDEANLWVAGLTGDGLPEVAVQQVLIGASWIPSHLTILAWRGESSLRPILSVSGSFPQWVEDLEGDGRYEVGNSFEIGDLPHYQQPLWTDIYAYRSGRYVWADDCYPREYREWPAQLHAALRQHPGDVQLLHYLGVTRRILGRLPSTAARQAQP